MFDKLAAWIKAHAKATLMKEIQGLDKYESVLADQIRERLDPKEKAKQVIALTEKELTDLVNKVFAWKFLHTWIFGNTVKDQLLADIQNLDNYDDDLAALLARHLDADAKSKLVIEYVQDFLTSLVNKYIP